MYILHRPAFANSFEEMELFIHPATAIWTAERWQVTGEASGKLGRATKSIILWYLLLHNTSREMLTATEATQALIFSLDRPLTLRTLPRLPAPAEESLIIFPGKLITDMFLYFILNELINEFTRLFLNLILQFKSRDISRKLLLSWSPQNMQMYFQ